MIYCIRGLGCYKYSYL